MDTDLRALAATNGASVHRDSPDAHLESLLAAERDELVARIRAIPAAHLPDPNARAALIALAQAGTHLAVYPSTTADGGDGTTIWLEPAHHSLDGRISCVEWTRSYHQDASERALRQLLPFLWQQRAAQQVLCARATGQVEAPLIYRTAVPGMVHDVEQRVAMISWRMMQAEGMAGVQRSDTIVHDVAAASGTAAAMDGQAGQVGWVAGRGGRAMGTESNASQALLPRLPGLPAGGVVVERAQPVMAPGLAVADFYGTTGCYLLAFLKDRQHIPYSGGASRRVGEHRNPLLGRAANLCDAVVHAGYELGLVHVWLGVSREFERPLKSRQDNAAYCPWCLWRPGPSEPPEPGQHTQRVELFAPALETEPAPRRPRLFILASALQFTGRYGCAYVLPKGYGDASSFGLVSEVPFSTGVR